MAKDKKQYLASDDICESVKKWVRKNREDAVSLVSELVRIPSVNNPPSGDEAAYQKHLAERLKDEGASVHCYELSEVEELSEHPAYMSGRDYTGRPNVVATFAGQGGGRSLLFSGHADTVYEGVETWTFPPFSGTVSNGKLYGRGSYDMKGGMAAAIMAVKCLHELGYSLKGDVY